MTVERILVLNGPNLDMLGKREPDVYGTETLGALEQKVRNYGADLGFTVSCLQSNDEGALIEAIHTAPGAYDAIVYNPGAHTHYSYALRDAVGAVDIPVVEVHLSDIDAREPFRSISVIAPACVAQVKGLGQDSYLRALDLLRERSSFSRLGEGFQEKVSGNPAIVVAAIPAGQEAATPKSNPVVNFAEPYRPLIAEQEALLPPERRLDATRAQCAQLGVGALQVRDTADISWLTGVEGVFDEERAHVMLIAANMAVIHTDSRYAGALRRALESCDSKVIVNDERQSHADFTWNLLTCGGTSIFNGMLGFEDSISYEEFVKLAEHFQPERIAPTANLVLGLRAVKDPGEILRMKAAQAVTDAAFTHIVGFMRPGMTERQVQLELEDYLLRHGGEGLAFRSIVATGANGANPHAVPGDAVLEAGQCVVMDFGARAFGYCSDMTRTVFLGAPDKELTQAWDALRQANEQVEALLRPGVSPKEAADLAEKVLSDGGFGGMMGHGLGHGVGLEVHELPNLNPRNGVPLVEGNVVTVEPGIYAAGRFGMRLEDFGAITASGFDVFTRSTHEMVII